MQKQRRNEEPGAQQGLLGVRDGGGGAEFAVGSALGGREERHHREGEGGDDDAGDGAFGLAGAGQGADGVDGDVRGEREEGDGDDPQGVLFAGLAYGVVAGGELPGDRGGGGDPMTESRPKPIRAVEEARLPAVRATTASITL